MDLAFAIFITLFFIGAPTAAVGILLDWDRTMFAGIALAVVGWLIGAGSVIVGAWSHVR